jgi:uncharacterized protein YndB with AHSA1/START domain
MTTLHFSTTINAPRETVWHTMLDDEPYRDWTSAFNPGSYYRGDWSEGSKILFLGPDPTTGREGGMVGRIAECRPYEFVSIKFEGLVQDGVEDTSSEIARRWAHGHENYTFRDQGEATEVQVELEVEEANAPMFEQTWPGALERLKALAERRA